MINESVLSTEFSKLDDFNRATFFPGGITQARKVAAGLQLLLKRNDISLLLRIYIDVAVRVLLFNKTNSDIKITLIIKYENEIPDQSFDMVIDYCRRLFSNFDYIRGLDVKENQEMIKNLKTMYRHRFEDNATKQNDSAQKPNYAISIDNPVYANLIDGSYAYMCKLWANKDMPLVWERAGSFETTNSPDPIDRYVLFDPFGKKYGDIYIDMYSDLTPEYYPDGYYSSLLLPLPTGKNILPAEKRIGTDSSIPAKEIRQNPRKKKPFGVFAILAIILIAVSSWYFLTHGSPLTKTGPSNQLAPQPFGLELGMTEEQVEKKMGKPDSTWLSANTLVSNAQYDLETTARPEHLDPEQLTTSNITWSDVIVKYTEKDGKNIVVEIAYEEGNSSKREALDKMLLEYASYLSEFYSVDYDYSGDINSYSLVAQNDGKELFIMILGPLEDKSGFEISTLSVDDIPSSEEAMTNICYLCGNHFFDYQGRSADVSTGEIFLCNDCYRDVLADNGKIRIDGKTESILDSGTLYKDDLVYAILPSGFSTEKTRENGAVFSKQTENGGGIYLSFTWQDLFKETSDAFGTDEEALEREFSSFDYYLEGQDDEELSEFYDLFSLDKEGAEYKATTMEIQDSLYATYFYDDSTYYWVTYRDGIIYKIYFGADLKEDDEDAFFYGYYFANNIVFPTLEEIIAYSNSVNELPMLSDSALDIRSLDSETISLMLDSMEDSDNTSIVKYGYFSENQIFAIIISNTPSTIQLYENVPESVYNSFQDASNQYAYYWNNIVSRYQTFAYSISN